MRENICLYLSFLVWLNSPNIVIFDSIHFSANDMISFFFMHKYTIVYVWHIFISHSSVDEGCCEHGYAGISIICWLTFLRTYDQEWYSFLRKLHSDFHSGCTNLLILTNSVWGSLNSTSSSAFVFVCFLDESQSDWGEMEFLHCFDLHLRFG
jgi:hypothetical protein